MKYSNCVYHQVCKHAIFFQGSCFSVFVFKSCKFGVELLSSLNKLKGSTSHGDDAKLR